MSAPAMTTTRRRSWIDEWERIPPAPRVINADSWDQLVWAINHDGAGKPLAFDDGFRACLRALGVSDHDIAVLFGEASEVADG